MTSFAQLDIEYRTKNAAGAAQELRALKTAAVDGENATDGLNKASKRLDTTTATTTKTVRRATDVLDKNRKVVVQNTGSIEGIIGSLHRYIPALSSAERGVANLDAKMGLLSKSAVTAAGKIGAMVGAALGIGQMVSVISEFDSQMSAVAAVSGATGAELESLRQTAKNLGSSTEFSAAQAASGLKLLTQAGYSAKNAIATIPSVLNLATTEAMDLGQATDYVVSIMAGFGLGVEKAANTTDVLVYASNAANTGVVELGEGLKYVGPIAASLGITLQESAAAMGILSNAGLKGTVAGTGLRSMLASLTAPTKTASDEIKSLGLKVSDLNPQTHSLTEIIDTLSKSGISAGKAFNIFGAEATPAVMALVANNSQLATLNSEMDNVGGTAKKVAAP